ncbi:inorganic phosphate cotransporter [Asbolus verrucosus]|uniref:Putative inorganic phosphate cotransporter n=1 Tax=Asbolus verrucosus TaxID=1661398 RepID=A0A482VKZ3_ASBVE|nr:inorganic phosphate cotransporter [Asbolus verrucosus]
MTEETPPDPMGAGQLGEYFGPKWFLCITIIVGSLFHILVPTMAASLGPTGVIICRVIQGLNQGFLYLSLHNLISRGSPLYERSTASSLVYGGSSLGTVISMKIPTPWKYIVTSLPFWAILITGCGQCWGAFTMLTEIPSYMSEIMNFDIKSNSQLSALPYFVVFIMSLIAAPVADTLISSRILKVGTTRKIFNALGTLLPAITLFVLEFVDSSQTNLVMAPLVVAVGATAFVHSGSTVNIIDLAPNHAGTFLGICNGISNIFSILGPLTVGFLGNDKKDPVLWRKVFWLAAGIYVSCNLFHIIFSSGELQSWNDVEEKDESSESFFGARHCQFLLMSMSLVIFFGMRTALSVGIIAMIEENPPDPDIPTYPEWEDTDTVLSSFFWGYLVTQIVAGQLSEYFGPKWFLVGTMLLGSVFNLLIPALAACWGSGGVMLCRVVQGLAQGFLYPCILNLMSKWTPAFERSRVSSFVYGGASVGIVTSMPLTGAIAGSTMGWPVACYLYGGLGILWTTIFAIFAANSPALHRWISEEEKLYIEKTTDGSNKCTKVKIVLYHRFGSLSGCFQKIPTPWKAIFTSLPMWAIFMASCGSSWGSFTLMTEIPSYMDNIMNFNINENSQLSSLPYVALLLTGLIGAPIADKLITNNIISIGTTRKIFTSLGSFVPATALICLGFVDSDQKDLATGLLIIAVGCGAFTQCGYLVNPIDLSPNHAGTITGIVNCFSTVFSILGPLSVQFLGSDKEDPTLWWNVFRLAAGIYVGCGVFYVLFSSGEKQAWNDTQEQATEKKPPTDVESNKTEVYIIDQ